MAATIAVCGLAFVAVGSGTAQDEAPAVVPDRIDDVREIRADQDSFPQLDEFAWRAFVALNWPSLTDAGHRGEPDRSKALGDAGPRVWETFKSRFELFQTANDGTPLPPPAWATYDAINPCGPGYDGRGTTLATFEPFMDFNQPIFGSGAAGNPLVAQNGTYTRYETRLNAIQYEALGAPGWSQGKNLPDAENPAHIPAGAIAVKAAWRILTKADTPAVRARYYVVEGANVVDVAGTRKAGKVVCSKRDIALVGLHIAIRTPFRPQGIWSSFEHVDNVPAVGEGEARAPDARDAGAPYSYFDPRKPEVGLWPEFGSPATLPVTLANPPLDDPEPMQVVRKYPLHPSTMALNRTYWGLPGIKGTVWEHYMLVANQWPTFTRPIAPWNDSVFFPARRGENLANTTMETYVQDHPRNCMSCHHEIANERGRDWVGIIDSFR